MLNTFFLNAIYPVRFGIFADPIFIFILYAGFDPATFNIESLLNSSSYLTQYNE